MSSLRPDQHPAHAITCDLAREALETFGVLRIRVNGWSMLPSIWPGDMLVISPLSDVEISSGDIVLLKREGRFFVHRVISSQGQGATVQTRGDAMLQADPPVGSRDLLGKVQYIIRNRKTVAPKRKLRLTGRIVAALARRWNAAARFIVGMKGVQQRVLASLS